MAKRGDPCLICFIPLTRDNKIGICTEHSSECRTAYYAAYAALHKEEKSARMAAWYAADKERQDALHAAWRETHNEEHAAASAAWKEAHPENGRASSARRKVRVKVDTTKEDMELSADYRLAIVNDPCYYCGAPGEEDDHYVSLANGGTDHWWNLVRACLPCNRRKGPKNGDEFK